MKYIRGLPLLTWILLYISKAFRSEKKTEYGWPGSLKNISNIVNAKIATIVLNFVLGVKQCNNQIKCKESSFRSDKYSQNAFM